jgi:lysozyme
MKTSPKGIALIEQFEGLRLSAYQDGAGIWTIGYGHTGLSGGPSRVKQGDVCTSAQADEWLEYDMNQSVRAVNTLVKAPINQNQFDALVSFTYNLGWASLEGSTLLRLVNARNPEQAAAEFPKWNHVAGEVSEGLTRRRLAEQALFLEAC